VFLLRCSLFYILNRNETKIVLDIYIVWEVGLRKVHKVKFLIIIGGAKFKAPSVVEKAYSSTIDCPSLHFIGTSDFPFILECIWI
jgi:hypothetical protein